MCLACGSQMKTQYLSVVVFKQHYFSHKLSAKSNFMLSFFFYAAADTSLLQEVS